MDPLFALLTIIYLSGDHLWCVAATAATLSLVPVIALGIACFDGAQAAWRWATR